MPQRRSKTLSTKVTAAEYELVTTLAGHECLGEWLRRVILSTRAPRTADQLLLAEILALRSIVLNLHYALIANELISPERMQRLIDDADRDKIHKALSRMTAASRLP